MTSFDRALALTLELEGEGAVSAHPHDRGGVTRWGISSPAWASWRKARPSLPTSVADATREQAVELYQARYWVGAPATLASHGWPALGAVVFDSAVHHGPRPAVELLQRAVGAEVDGVAGPLTWAAVGSAVSAEGERAVCLRLLLARAGLMGRIVVGRPGQLAFLAGWLRRLEVIAERLDILLTPP